MTDQIADIAVEDPQRDDGSAGSCGCAAVPTEVRDREDTPDRGIYSGVQGRGAAGAAGHVPGKDDSASISSTALVANACCRGWSGSVVQVAECISGATRRLQCWQGWARASSRRLEG